MQLFKLGFYVISFTSFLVWKFDVLYVYFFGNPIFMHTYLNRKTLLSSEKIILKKEVSFYQKLNNEEQLFFEHRLTEFIETYQFIGRGGYKVTSQTKVLIGSVYVMLTFGMRKYRTKVFNKIVVYPKQFHSKAHSRNHKGEFNFRYKTIVFSWEDFVQGVKVENDNLHLGIHEFTHSLSFHGKISRDYSATVFNKIHKEIITYIKTPENVIKIKSKNYFRKYAFTNSLEFIAVMMEYFFESPIEFKKHFPELYTKVVKMINYKSFLNLQ